jgi:TolB protein
MRFAALLIAVSASLAGADSKYLAKIRQLTHGGSNAEAYWSPDGKRLVFQSTRPPYECDQIFTMNADGSDVRLVSTGKGRTTCAYFLPDNKHILYASTHEASSACPPRPDHSNGYVWGVFPGYDIFLATDRGEIVKKVAAGAGYDAEATVNWKSGQVVYTSQASGDLDLWTMRTDGSGKRRITTEPGYDGGAVFSRDGTKLVWRSSAFSGLQDRARYKELLAQGLVAPMKMDLVVAEADGSNPRRIVEGCANFAPTFMPDGKRIVFSSNRHKCDSRFFELYQVNPDGTGLEQITDFGGFTSFPEFSPDGGKMVFVSDRNAAVRYEFNVFVAEWSR